MRILAVSAALGTVAVGSFPVAPSSAPPDDSSPPDAVIVNDEGGPVTVTGEAEFTNVFTSASDPGSVVILEDQAGFVDRDRSFVMSEESQVLAQIETSGSTLSYTLSLPIEPAAALRDVDHDDVTETGVMVYAVAYWTDTWGDAYLEERDLGGGGWSTAYASTRIDPDPSAEGEVTGGTYLIYAPDDEQSFPSGFGPDGRLFTDDDPIVDIPSGYTVVGLDTDTFTFDRSRDVTIDLIEGEGLAAVDFSDLSYADAFDEMVELFRTRYAFTELKGIDWEAMAAEFRPRFEQADQDGDETGYLLALRDFLWQIPDSHVGFDNLLDFPDIEEMFFADTDGGLGLAIRELDDGSTIANFVLDGGPAALAGIELGAEIIAFDGVPIADVVGNTQHWSGSWSTETNVRLQQLRYSTRFPVDTGVSVTYRNPGAAEATATLIAIRERESFAFSSFNAGLSGVELPLDFEVLPSGHLLVTIYSFADDDVLQIRLWERAIELANLAGLPGVIIDLRQNGGGRGFLADQMAAYFFDEPHVLGNTSFYDESSGEFYPDPDTASEFIPPAEEMQYHGPLAVIVGPNCVSACEFFTYNVTIDDRASVVGHYPTAGGGGSVNVFRMPLDAFVRYTVGRAVDADGSIHIEGRGIAPTLDVPVTAATLLGERDALVDAAVKHLDRVATAPESGEGAGLIAPGDTVTGTLPAGERVRYDLDAAPGEVVTITLTGDSGAEGGLLDPYLRVYDASTDELYDENDDSDSLDSALGGVAIPDGGLVIEVGSYGDEGGGGYTLEVSSP